VKIKFDQEKEDQNLSTVIPNIPGLSSNTKYSNPTLISGQDSFELQENAL
jgi:hypothetical protein